MLSNILRSCAKIMLCCNRTNPNLNLNNLALFRNPTRPSGTIFQPFTTKQLSNQALLFKT